MKNIYIFTGQVHSGKTTRVMKWASTQKNIDGIFQPVIDDKRFLYNIASRSLKILETDETENITAIGNYKFSNAVFNWANKILINCRNKKLDWIIVDEIGPLELQGKALEPSLKHLFANCNNEETRILSIVRQELVEKVVEYFGIDKRYKIFDADQLKK